jgi:hypothetical protein
LKKLDFKMVAGRKRYGNLLKCATCKKEFVAYDNIGTKKFCSCSCRAKFCKGEKSPRWIGGRIKDEFGYIKIRVGKKYVREHTLAVKKVLKDFPKGYVVHHIDFNKENNSLDNLCLMTRSEHMKLHQEKLRNEETIYVEKA